MKIIGVTGSSGAGKNSICEIIEREYNAEIIDADQIAKELSKKGTMYLKSIIDCFGTEIIDRKGELDRKKLANIIFEDKNKREELNKLTFIYVVDEIQKRIKYMIRNIIVINAPLLFESNLNKICDFVIAVISNKDKQIDRIMKRDNITKESAEKRIKAQNTNEFFKENADYIIYNNEELENMEQQLKKIKI